MPKILSAHDAVRQYIHDGDTVTFGGFASGLMHPESILRALEERARNGEGPHGLTALYAAGQGDSDSRGLNHLGSPPSWAGCARKTSWPATTCPRG